MSWLIGCVADRSPKYLDQALRLVQSIRWFGGTASDADLVVCCVGGAPNPYLEQFARYGVRTVTVEPYNAVHPYSNKLRFLQMEGLSAYDQVVLLDCDTIVTQDPAPHLRGAWFAAKPADVATVTADIFRRLFEVFEIAWPASTVRCTVSGELSIPYFNSGVISFSREAVGKLLPAWLEIHDRLLRQLPLLEDRQMFCDQASLALAVAATRAPVTSLSNALNFPLHFAGDPAAANDLDVDAVVIHYHSLVDPSGQIKERGLPKVDARIRAFNQKLREEREREFNNRLFWDSRYALDPMLGSGLGSRGESMEFKRKVLAQVVKRYRPKTILDVGCGDLAVGSALPAQGYLGIDVSETVIRLNGDRYPDRRFRSGDFLAMDLSPADMVVCLDVLIHLSDRETYRRFVTKLVAICRGVGVVAGDDTDQRPGPIVFFHESLHQTLHDSGARNIRKLGCYRHVTLYEYSGGDQVLSVDRKGLSARTAHWLRGFRKKSSS